jgi:predicted Zn-dependent peptidase
VLVKAVDRSRLPRPAGDPPFTFPEVVRRALPNGLGVWTVEYRDLPVLSFVLLLSRGSAEDPRGRQGLASITADMLDEGSGSRSALDIEEELSRLGAQMDTEVGSDAAVLSLLTLARHGDEALGLLADMVARPRLSDEDFDRVRHLRLTRLSQLHDLAPVVADRMLTRLLYPGHPYGHLPLGLASTLKTVTPEDVREFHARTWRPSRLTLIAVGDCSHDELMRAAERAFGWWTPDGEDHVPDDGRLAPPAEPAARLAIVDRPGAAQSELRVGQVAVPRLTPDYHALLVLNAILGGQFVSRLNMNLREDKGYTYGARSGFDFRRSNGPFSVQAAVQTTATAESVQEVLAEITAIGGERPATPGEVELARSSLTRGYPRNFETAGQVARGLAQLALYGLPDDTFERFVPTVEAVSAEDVTRASARLDPARMTVVVVGDRAKVEPSLSALGIGAPEVMEHEE